MGQNIALIPARSGSKGVKNKNIKNIYGYPLIEWSINAALKADNIDRVIVSTDSENYAQYAIKAGAEVPFLRPKNISLDISTDFECIEHTLNWMQKNDNLPELIVHIRPTTPLRDPFLIDKAIEIFKVNDYGTSLRSVHQMSESSYKNFEISNGILKPLGFSQVSIDSLNDARQSFPKTYVANGYVDVLSVDFIRKNGCIHGNYVIPFLTPKIGEIDTIDDLEYIEYQISKNPKLFERLFSTNLN